MSVERGYLDMKRLGELLIEAAAEPRNREGMVVSATGAVSISARALTQLSELLPEGDYSAEDLREIHEDRIDHEQPRMAAFTLEQMGKHFAMLRDAVAKGDAQTVGRFFDLYVFD